MTTDWKRPPHIHFKVTAPKRSPLITQRYFSEEEELNKKDRILQRIARDRQSLVITKLTQDSSIKMRVGQFNIVLDDSDRQQGTPADL